MAVERDSVDALLKRVDEFFMAEGAVHKTMRALARRLSQEGIDYAPGGGMARVLSERKLSSGMTAPDRLRPLAEVQELIKIRRLGADFAERLDPYVRDKY